MRFIHYLSPILLGLAVNVSAQVFEASGVGDTPETAKKDAINNAIRFGAGEFVLSKEELNNDDFSQKITSHSNAYIKQIEVKSQVKLPNGSYEAQVAVDLENQALLKSLKEMKVAVAEDVVDNEALLQALNHFDKNDTVKNKEKNLKELIYELLFKPIKENKEIYRVEILGKLKPQPNSDKFPFELEYQITPMYMDNLNKIFTEIDMNETGNQELTSQYINVYDLRNIQKNLPSKSISMTMATSRALWHSALYYRIIGLKFRLIDKNDIEFKTEDMYFGHNSRVMEAFKSFNILLGSYQNTHRFSLTKDEILGLKNIKVSLIKDKKAIDKLDLDYFLNP